MVGTLSAPGKKIIFETHEVPTPKGDEICMRIKASGCCHTDVHICAGELGTENFPIHPCHEGTGIVHRMGDLVDRGRFSIGDHIGIPWLGDSCGSCENCETAHEQLCKYQQNTGFSVQGTCSDYVIIKASHAVKIPTGLSYEQAAPLMCAGVTVYSALCAETSGLQAGDWVAIVGAAGGLGHLAVQYAKAMGFRVCALDTGPRKADLALSLGADVAFDSTIMASHRHNGDKDNLAKPAHGLPSESLAEFVNRVRMATANGCHAVLSLAPVMSVIESSSLLVRTGGTLVMVAIPPGDITINLRALVFNGITIKGSIVGNRDHLQHALAFAGRGLVKCHIHIRSFSEVNEVLADLAASKYEGRVVLSRVPQEQESGIV